MAPATTRIKMYFQYTPGFAVLGVTAIIAAAMAFTSWLRCSTPAQTTFTLLMVSVSGYATVAALESAAIALPNKIFWSTLEYVFSGAGMTFLLIFAIYFTSDQEWLTFRQVVWLWIIPVFDVILVATNKWHKLVWTGFLPGASGSNLIVYQHGPGFFWVMFWVYVYVFAGSSLLFKAAIKPSMVYRRQAGSVLIGCTAPLIASTLYMLNLAPPGLNITPMSFLVTGLAFSDSLFRFRLFDVVPIARDTLIESMSDGVLVLDVRNRIVDLNPAAQSLIGTTTKCVGQPIAVVLAQHPNILRVCYQNKNDQVEIQLAQAMVDLEIKQLRDRYGRFSGRLIVLRDITQRYQAEIELRKVNERLHSQLLAIEGLQAQLREQVIRDKLTGLLNRRYFDEVVPKELARALNGGYSVALIMLDIDYFKKINDTFGHKAGDDVLQAFGPLLLSQVRTGDIACRMGGEEFVLVLPSVSLERAYQLAEKIRLAFQALKVKTEDREIYSTISGGIAMFPTNGTTEDELLQAADQALYNAKGAGRNCIKIRT
ncbi:diguanylate cyclase with PAS/PAC sensor [Crinalium epipsammum PCC 9333]|uniref:Diguanylate cyclase with PAS/PAC sensor n=1 Tax=Crinalium epipsammum PCC 9333 TaxID=1173022 RepID=K9W5W9_9CYAN|nr:histidine kinase N-terminal 7TM domain-containing protein [Crinalium epipsammum]AFZ15194.1 diguanylate cyclase with PAS/PAC sensor [Crinalium epipsammum PCC 9333]